MSRVFAAASAVAVTAAALAAAAPSPAQMDMAGHEHGMYVLPGPTTVTDAQRANAEHLVARARREARRWSTRRQARRDGYRPIGSRPDSQKQVFHYNSAARLADGRTLDPRRPESLVYWQQSPGHYVLVALMFRVPSRGPVPHPAGGLMRWHVHYRCVMADEAPGARQGPCAAGEHMHTGPTAMTHVWFVDGLDHAFDVERPSTDLFRPIPQS